MSLLEREAIRVAAALGDYDYVSVRAVVQQHSGFVVQFSDDRFGCDYVIGSHFDYWDFVGYLVDHKQWPTRPLTVPPGVASNGPGSAAALVDAAPGAVSLRGVS